MGPHTEDFHYRLYGTIYSKLHSSRSQLYTNITAQSISTLNRMSTWPNFWTVWADATWTCICSWFIPPKGMLCIYILLSTFLSDIWSVEEKFLNMWQRNTDKHARFVNCKHAKKDVRKNYCATSHFFKKCFETYLCAAYDHYDGEDGELTAHLYSTIGSRLIRTVHNTIPIY